MRTRRWLAPAVAAAVVAGGLVPAPAAAAVPANPAAPASPQIVSITASGAQANQLSGGERVSGDGRYVAFSSSAYNLVTNRPVRTGVNNVYLKDRLTGSIQLISHASGGADGASYPVDVSADGRYVLYISYANNLVYNDTNSPFNADLFRWDRSVDDSTLVSLDSAGTQIDDGTYSGSMSDDGQYVVFDAAIGPAPANFRQTRVRNLRNQTTELVSVNVDGNPGNNMSWNSRISGNGRFVTFQSWATDLVDPPLPSSPSHISEQIYVRDLLLGITSLISLPNGSRDNHDPTINEDGSVVAYVGGYGSIWVWEMFSNSTVRVDYGASGWANYQSEAPVLNADGTVLAFVSYASNLDPDGDTNRERDIYVTDPRYGGIHRVSTAGRGCEPNGTSYGPDLSADGTLVVFGSDATNLTRQDGTSWDDVFVAPTRSHPPTDDSDCQQ